MKYTTVSVDVDLDDVLGDIDTDDLIDELRHRNASISGMDGYSYLNNKEILEALYQKRRLGQDYQLELDMLIYNVLGKII